MQRVEVQQVIQAGVQQVWDRYTDHAGWTRWARLGTVRVAREGVPPPNGVGSVREIRTAGFKVYEEVLSFEPPHRMTYRLIRGLVPLRDHLGEVTFEPHPRGTLVTWRCRFNAAIPGLGGPLRMLVTRLFCNALRNLSRQRFAS